MPVPLLAYVLLFKSMCAFMTVATLSLSSSPIRQQGAIEIAKMLMRNSTLTELKLEENKCSAKALMPMAEALRRNMCKLRLLNLRGHRSTIEHAAILGRAFSGSTTLEELYFGRYHSIPVQDVAGNRRKEPYTLNLSAYGYGPHEASLIGGMFFHNSLLTGLDLSGNPLTTPPEKLVPPNPTIPPYHELHGYDRPSMNDGPGAVHTRVVVRILPPPMELVHGLARESRQEGILMLARNIEHMPVNNLKFLDLQKCGVDCAGAYHLATHLIRNTSLQTLIVGEVPLNIQKVCRLRSSCDGRDVRGVRCAHARVLVVNADLWAGSRGKS